MHLREDLRSYTNTLQFDACFKLKRYEDKELLLNIPFYQSVIEHFLAEIEKGLAHLFQSD